MTTLEPEQIREMVDTIWRQRYPGYRREFSDEGLDARVYRGLREAALDRCGTAFGAAHIFDVVEDELRIRVDRLRHGT